MSDIRKARHRRRKTALYVGVPLALTAAGVMAYGAVFGIFGEDAKPKASAATATPAWAAATADGFASVDALGQNGTYGGRDGKTVTVRTLADLEKYATASDPYVIVVAAAITMDPVGKERRPVSAVPILMITGRDAVGDRIVALDNGADDYLMKPFASEELLARVRALLRRSPRRRPAAPGPAPEHRLSFEDVATDPRTRTVTRDDRPLDLTRTEYALLEYLLRHPARVLSRAQILKEVWGFGFEPTSNTLDVYVMYLRRKLESRGGPRLIHTVRGLGYTLRAK